MRELKRYAIDEFSHECVEEQSTLADIVHVCLPRNSCQNVPPSSIRPSTSQNRVSALFVCSEMLFACCSAGASHAPFSVWLVTPRLPFSARLQLCCPTLVHQHGADRNPRVLALAA